MDLTNRNSFFRVQAGGIFSLILVIFGIVESLLLPTYRDLMRSENELLLIRTKADSLKENMSAFELQQTKLHTYQRSFEGRFDSVDEAMLDPLEWLQTQAVKADVTISSFQDQRHNIVNSLPAVDISLEASGTFQQICQLLNNLERSPRACFITELTIDTPTDSKTICQVTMRVLVFPLDKQLKEQLQNRDRTNSASIPPSRQNSES